MAEDRDSAAADAAALILAILQRQVVDPLAPAGKILQSIRPVYGIDWNRASILHLETETINPILCKMRNSLIPRAEYNRIADFPNGAFSASGLVHPPPPSSWSGER